jgi:hypothetical protein
MVQVAREAGIEIGAANDAEILDVDAGLRRWVHVPVGDVAKKGVDAEAVKRKLSVEVQAPSDISTDRKDALEM